MKVIKFTPELTKLIKSGEKNVTFRLFDDKNLSKNDEVLLATRTNENVTNFAEAVLTYVHNKKIKDLLTKIISDMNRLMIRSRHIKNTTVKA